MARILIVDDDADLLELLSLAIHEAGHAALRARDGVAAAAALRDQRPDLAICDVNLPKLDGFSLLKQVRAGGDETPVILLTSRDDEIDEALGLELGAQDYVSKPFSTRVLMARVGALLRREALRRGGTAPQPLQVGELALDAERLEARYRTQPIELTVTEFKLLEALARRPGVVFTRDQLLELIRGDESAVADRIIDTYVRRLRRKLEAVEAGFDAIETVIGAGYRWRSRD